VATGTFSYSTRFEVQGTEVDVESTRSVRRVDEGGREVLEIESTSTTPAGEVRDRYVLDASTLHPLSREVEQGQVTIDMAFGRQQVTGEIRAGAQEIPVAIDLEAPVFGDEGALEAVLTALPLEVGYGSPVRVAEVGEQQRVRYFRVEVVEEASIEVPAGDMLAWRIELSPIDDADGAQTLWVSSDGMLLRAAGPLPAAMGSGTFVTELRSVDE
jgi:hypothetical protein